MHSASAYARSCGGDRSRASATSSHALALRAAPSSPPEARHGAAVTAEAQRHRARCDRRLERRARRLSCSSLEHRASSAPRVGPASRTRPVRASSSSEPHARRGSRSRSSSLEPLRRVLPDRLEHPVAAPVRGEAKEALLDERLQGVEVGVATSSAASSVQPPAKTERRAKSCCSSGRGGRSSTRSSLAASAGGDRRRGRPSAGRGDGRGARGSGRE